MKVKLILWVLLKKNYFMSSINKKKEQNFTNI